MELFTAQDTMDALHNAKLQMELKGIKPENMHWALMTGSSPKGTTQVGALFGVPIYLYVGFED